jgi:NAD(P)-dependent dehydrogenase (short-subunit alcohol dehydrogenase family)
MNLGLAGKVALVTGASKGIGEAIAKALAEEGVNVALVARDAQRLAAAANDIAARSHRDAHAIAADLTHVAEVQRVVEHALAHFGRIDILVNNAGSIRTAPFLEMPDEHWLEDWTLKPLGYVRLARTIFPHMVAQGGGRIVNVAGLAARNPAHVYASGGAANAAIVNLTKSLADLGAPHQVLVNAVSPGATRTGRLDAQIAAKAAANKRTVAEEWADKDASHPLGRIARPEDVADLVCFLVSERAAFITGICVTLDGGSSRGVYL